jgi:hypothetical protein
VSTEDRTYYDQIVQALDELRSLCNNLKIENGILESKVKNLESIKLQKTDSYPDSTLDGLTDNDRIALRNQLNTYIKRIDQILESS